MTNRTNNDELEEFKIRINLTEFAAGSGYTLDKNASSRNSALMVGANGDKIVIARGHDAHYVYFSVHDDNDSGSIIDFVQRRDGGNLGQVRKRLRPWVGGSGIVSPQLYIRDLEPLSRDIAGVRARYAAFLPIAGTHDYLERERDIPSEIISDERFASRIRTDERGNAFFPHFNIDGICGYEIKNTDFTGFARGGEKGLWCSRPSPTPQTLVVAETAIDALSYAALYPAEYVSYVSIAGQLSPAQDELLKAAFAKMPADSEIILALDNDDGGRKLTDRIEGLYSHEDCPGATLRVHMPAGVGQDWNDVLRANMDETGPWRGIDPPSAYNHKV